MTEKEIETVREEKGKKKKQKRKRGEILRDVQEGRERNACLKLARDEHERDTGRRAREEETRWRGTRGPDIRA